MKKFMLRVMPIVLVALLIVGNTVFAVNPINVPEILHIEFPNLIEI